MSVRKPRGSRRKLLPVIPALLLAAGVGLPGTAASAAVLPAQLPQDERAAGQWYAADWMNLDKLAERGATGEGVKIAVIDSAINPDLPELQGANIRVMGSTCMDPETGKPWEAVNTDPVVSAHGTNAVAMLVGNGVAGDGGLGARGIAPAAEIMFYGVGPVEPVEIGGRKSYWETCVLNDPTVEPGEQSLLDDPSKYAPSPLIDNRDGADELYAKEIVQQGDSTALAARAAIRDGADVISLSIISGGVGPWDQAIIEAQRAGVPVVIGTYNPTDNLLEGGITRTYQANGIVPVNALEQDGSPLRGDAQYEASGASNLAFAAPGRDLLGVGVADGWGPELIHGTSYATPLVAGTIALGLQKFPDATANQVLQAMIRTTGAEALHEPEWGSERYGFGTVDPVSLLDTDPTDYPDENPMFVTSIEDPRCDYPIDSAQRGREGSIVGGYWDCYWSIGPTPEDAAEYWAALEPESGNIVAPLTPEPNTAVPVWLVAAGGVGALIIVAAAVLVPILVARSRKRRRAEQPQTAAQGAQPQYAPPAQAPAQHPEQAQYQHPNSHERQGDPGAENSGGQS